MTKAKKIDANSWSYRGFTIDRCTHSRTFLATRPDGTKTYVRDRLRDAVSDIDCWHWKQWDIQDRASRAACERNENADCPDQQTCRHGIDN
jgi:oligoribonuclease NrnB/cAMP/cGMP phosphodiesterase (DHH superfamily)